MNLKNTKKINIIQVDYHNPDQARELIFLLNVYAEDPMGGGSPLKEEVQKKLPTSLANFPGAFSLILYYEGRPAGLANCFEGFSTFKAKPLINIHDLVILKEFRGKKLSTLLLNMIQKIARQRGSCKITLEVLADNEAAKHSYEKFGFERYNYTKEAGDTLFWQKYIG